MKRQPTRMNLQGNKELAAIHAGDAKRMLFQLKNIQSTNATINELTKRYEDGTIINVHTKVDGMDVVNIISGVPIEPKKEKRTRKETEKFPVPIIMVYTNQCDEEPIGGYVAEKFIGRYGKYIKLNDKDKIEETTSVGKDSTATLKELNRVGNYNYIRQYNANEIDDLVLDGSGWDSYSKSTLTYSGTICINDPSGNRIADLISYNLMGYGTCTVLGPIWLMSSPVTYSYYVEASGADGNIDADAYWEDENKYIVGFLGRKLFSDTTPDTSGVASWYRYDGEYVLYNNCYSLGSSDNAGKIYYASVFTEDGEFVLFESNYYGPNDAEDFNMRFNFVDIFDYDGKPFYMYGFYVSYYDEEGNESGGVTEYGCIYNGEKHAARFDSLDNEECTFYHKFDSFEYIDNDGNSKTITLREGSDLSELFGNQYWNEELSVRAGKYEVETEIEIE